MHGFSPLAMRGGSLKSSAADCLRGVVLRTGVRLSTTFALVICLASFPLAGAVWVITRRWGWRRP